MFHANIGTLQFIVDTLIPFAVAFLVQRFTNERVKSGITAVAALIVAVLQEAINASGTFDIPDLLGKLVTALVAAYLSHQFIWKPVGLTGDSGLIMRVVPFGIGKVDPVLRLSHQTAQSATRAA